MSVHLVKAELSGENTSCVPKSDGLRLMAAGAVPIQASGAASASNNARKRKNRMPGLFGSRAISQGDPVGFVVAAVQHTQA